MVFYSKCSVDDKAYTNRTPMFSVKAPISLPLLSLIRPPTLAWPELPLDKPSKFSLHQSDLEGPFGISSF